jgi:crossover junction endodeoxyribonuclease RusA
MIIKLPFPDASLFPNRMRGSFHNSTDAKQKQRDAAFYITKAAGAYKPESGHIPLSLLFVMPDKRNRDCDNMLAASKWLLDGMAKALGIDDKRFKPLLVDWVHGSAPGALIAAVGVSIVSSHAV